MMGITKWITLVTRERYPTPCLQIRNMDRGQVAAISESHASYAHHAVAHRDGSQAAALIECAFSDSLHAVGNRDGGHASTTAESTFTNTRYRIWDSY